MPPFRDLDALNDWLEQHCQELWTQTQHGSEPGTIADVWAQEVEALMPVGRQFNGFVEYTQRVSSTCLLHLERNRKTHLATALGVQAIEQHKKRVRFFSTVDLVNALEQEKDQGRSGQRASRLSMPTS